MYISYSLWGSNKVYTYGIIENALQVGRLLPEWTLRVHYNDSVPVNIVNWLKNAPNVHLIYHQGVDCKASNMFWRFEDLFLHNTTVLIRDADSRISVREVRLIKEWLASDKDFHIIRDHPGHKVPILGGTMGCRNNCLKYIGTPSGLRDVNAPPMQFNDGITLMRNFYKNVPLPKDRYNLDQIFLYTYVYQVVVYRSMIHCSHNAYEPFVKRIEPVDTGFVGEVCEKCPEAATIFGDVENSFTRVAQF
tara:strand:- start:829 stop:1572 length:744 start_codon:yes stop_codon:yes gene_type:complete